MNQADIRRVEQRLSNEQLIELMQKRFALNQPFPLIITGTSMLPTVAPARDQVLLTPLTRPLKKYDVPLYQRGNGTIVLHRIVQLHDDGSFDCCGDNQFTVERCVRPEQALAVAAAFYRKGKLISVSTLRYRLYVRLLRVWRLLRKAAAALRRKHN